jgi:DoxX-like family
MKSRWVKIAGFVLHLLIGGLMIFAGSAKSFGFAPPELGQKMAGYGLGSFVKIIGFGEMISALLLLIPQTVSLGTLLVSAFWGGVICIHMSHHEDFLLPSGLLVLTWLGAFLREPRTLASFTR